MECDICGKKGDNFPLLCTTCARSALEIPRIELAVALIERDKIGKHVQAVVEGSEDQSSQYVSLTDSKGGLLVDRHECTKNVDIQRIRAETAEHEERVQLISDQADRLRQQIEEARKELEEKRGLIARRKSDLSSATYGIDTRRMNEADKVQNHIKRIDYRMDKSHRETMESRLHQCSIAAKLAGLKMNRRKLKDGSTQEIYSLGPGPRYLRIYDLRNLHEASSDVLSASLGLVAQLLVRVACYLGVRLPAEITLPHNDYPMATIFQPASSYLGRKVPFPAGGHSSTNSPEGSRTLDTPNLPKPRTLFIDRPLPHLSAQDAPAYSLFIEGVSLLAYNIAWLCRTQGLKEDFNTWEDVSPMGRNLYRLFITQETHPPAKLENPLDKDLSPKGSAGKAPARTSVGFGELSHATSHSFLGAAENVQYLSGWSLTPTKIMDELRSFLLAEQQAQEWDVLSQKEWEDMEDMIAQDPVVVGSKVLNLEESLALTTKDGKKATASQDGAGEVGKTDDRKRGVSGWTKLKSRNDG
jgi:hypothetical protein